MPFLPSAVAAAALLIFVGPDLLSQAGQEKSLQHEVSVTLKLVQVYVTGKGGQSVTDLSAGDFEVIDNGQSFPVTHFEKHFLDIEETLAADVPTPRMNRKFLFVFDFAFMDARGVLKSKNAALRFLDGQIRPTDEIGLITYSALRGLVLHEYLTMDHQRIRSMIDSLGLRSHLGRAESLTDYIYLDDLTTRRSEAAQATEAGATNPEEQFYSQQATLQTQQMVEGSGRQGYLDQARHFVWSLGNLAKVLRTIPGFKNVLLFSGGIARQVIYGKTGGAVVAEWSTPEQLVEQLSTYDAAQSDSGLRTDFGEMLKEFKASNAPVYAIDVSRTKREQDVVVQGAGQGVGIREFEGTDSLRQFASETGGKFYANTMENQRIVSDIQSITGAYYVLGYPVNEKWDGKFHKIKVKVNRKGLKVITQGGYFGAKPFEQFSSFEKLLHVVDLALSDEPQVQIPYEIPAAGLPVLVKGWPQLLVFCQASLAVQTEVLGQQTEAYLLLFDDKGDMAYIKRFSLSIPETGKETLFPAFLLAVKPGSYSGRLVLRNMETGRGARGAVSIVMPATGGATLTLDPPLLLGPATNSLDLAATPGGSLAELFAYDANAYAPLLGDIPAGLTKLLAALRLTGSSASGGLELTVTLVDTSTSGRTELPVSVLKQDAAGGTKVLFVEIATGELKAGRYILGFAAKDLATGMTAVASTAIMVK
jgi:VWFA-related protein